jgi:phosphatidylglycerol lysyltransferase
MDDPLRLTARRPHAGGTTPEEHERARELILAFGWNSTSYQILNPGIRLWFCAHPEAVVGYVEHAGVWVVAGAPVCAAERLLAVATRFEEEAERAGCRVCYFGAESRLESAEHASPRHSRVLLGAQPVWTPRSWVPLLRHHASLRAQISRARNKGVAIAEWPTSSAHHPQIERCLGEWLAGRRMPALHFLVEPRTLTALTDRRLFVAERGGEPVGFLLLSPVPRRNGWLVEQIVRGAAAPNGTAESLIDAAFSRLAEEGFDYVTLGLAPLSRRAPFSPAENPAWLRGVLHAVRSFGRRFYNFEGLDAFKAKLQPDGWEPVFAIANQKRFSPRMLWAIAAAFSGGSPLVLAGRALARKLRPDRGGRSCPPSPPPSH